MEIKDAKMYTVKEIEELLGLERRIIYKLIDDGRLHGVPTKFKEKKRVIGKFLKQYINGGNNEIK